MVCALYTLKKQLAGKKIYIWNINRNSMIIFTKAFFRKIDIQGFVTIEKKYVGKVFLNRPVFYLEQVDEENSVILVSDSVSKDIIGMMKKNKAVYWSEALELNWNLHDKKIIVYGTGEGANRLCHAMQDIGIEPELFCVTSLKGTIKYRDKTVIESSELIEYEDHAIVISVMTQQFIWEIIETLSGFHGLIYLDMKQVINSIDLVHLNFIQNLDCAYRTQKEIYLYSKRNVFAELIEDAAKIYGIKIAGYVYACEDQKQDVQNIRTVTMNGTADKMLILNAICPQHILEARKIIEQAGFSLEQGNYTGIKWIVRASEKVLMDECQERRDSLVGGSIAYLDGKPGWKVYGKEEEGRIKIVILGNSTSSEIYLPENWISRLYNKLKKDDIKVTIFNGTHSGDDIVVEILRLLRDGEVLKPQIVISFSGVNNIFYKRCENQFNVDKVINRESGECLNGISSNESLYSFWSRNMRLLQCISKFYGAKFFGFLQPMNLTMDEMDLYEKSLYELDTRILGAKDFSQNANDTDIYINLMRMFEHQNEMYFDMCHYTDKGHESIADKVYKTIKPIIVANRSVWEASCSVEEEV